LTTLSHLIVCSILQIRLTEAQLQKTAKEEMKPEQLEKLTKLEGLHKELKLLEDKKAEMAAS
jgi:partner of Y14 and mago protein